MPDRAASTSHETTHLLLTALPALDQPLLLRSKRLQLHAKVPPALLAQTRRVTAERSPHSLQPGESPAITTGTQQQQESQSQAQGQSHSPRPPRSSDGRLSCPDPSPALCPPEAPPRPTVSAHAWQGNLHHPFLSLMTNGCMCARGTSCFILQPSPSPHTSLAFANLGYSQEPWIKPLFTAEKLEIERN